MPTALLQSSGDRRLQKRAGYSRWQSAKEAIWRYVTFPAKTLLTLYVRRPLIGNENLLMLRSIASEMCIGANANCMQASGAADGFVRLWQVKRGVGISRSLEAVGQFTATGFVNSLSIASSGRFALAGLGQEPRLGRWGQVKDARSGILLQPLLISAEES